MTDEFPPQDDVETQADDDALEAVDRSIAPGKTPPEGPPPQKTPPMSFLERVAALGIYLWGLATIAALGGLVFFLFTFLSKYKLI
jgi:hypothetical protein